MCFAAAGPLGGIKIVLAAVLGDDAYEAVGFPLFDAPVVEFAVCGLHGDVELLVEEVGEGCAALLAGAFVEVLVEGGAESVGLGGDYGAAAAGSVRSVDVAEGASLFSGKFLHGGVVLLSKFGRLAFG